MAIPDLIENGVYQRFWDLPELEEYILSICLTDPVALAKSMSSLLGIRDFKNAKNRKAFAVIESRYEKGEKLDPVVIIDTWTDLGIFSKTEADTVANAYKRFPNETDYSPKIEELRKAGSIRQAKKDILALNEQSNGDTSVDALSQKALDMAISWGSGSAKKYYSAREVEEIEDKEDTGKHLRQGIPLLDEKVYLHAGQRQGTMKGTIFREKHGKTRHACWEVAQDIRQGHKVLYVTLEGAALDVKNNIKEVLQDEWDNFKQHVFFVDGTVDVDEIISAIIEALFTEEIDKIVIDYLQLMQQPNARQISENVNSNRCCADIGQIMNKYNLHVHMLAQARQAVQSDYGYGKTPDVYDVYGSNSLIKWASLILVGIRPKNYEELLSESVIPPYAVRAKGPNDGEVPINSVFIKPILSRKKIEHQHRWMHFVDSNQGMKIYSQDLI